MKKLTVLFVICALIFGYSSSNAQPKFTLQLHGGYSMPMMQLKGNLPSDPEAVEHFFEHEDADYNTYYMKTGFNFGLTGKYAFGKKGNIRLTFGGDYKMFNNSSEITSTVEILKIEPKMNIIAINVGGEYAVTGKSKFTPYFGIDLTANIFGGESHMIYTINSQTFFDYTWKLATATRFGIGAGAGLDYAFSKQVGINFGVKYNMMNLIGKDADTSISTNTDTEQPLNDKEHTTLYTAYASKNIADLQIYAGVSFYFGLPKKTVKK